MRCQYGVFGLVCVIYVVVGDVMMSNAVCGVCVECVWKCDQFFFFHVNTSLIRGWAL